MKLFFWIVVAKLLVITFILYSGIGLMPDEAQYWTWSKDLSYGYYSKPAGIAWQIAFGCFFFGDTEFGVRFGSVVLSTFLSLGIYWLAKGSGLDEKKAFWTAVIFSFCPLGILSAFFATTDCAYVLFWTLVCALFVRSYSFIAIGLLIGLGALWKWPIYAIWLPILYFKPSRKVILGMALSLLGLIPSLWWNIQNGFATFLHVFTSIDPVHTQGSRPNPLDFIGAQFALVSPVLFVLLLWAAFTIIRRYKQESQAMQFCCVTFCAFFLVIFASSFFRKVQGNWAIGCYPTAFVLLVWAFKEMRLIKIGAGVALFFVLAAFSLPFTDIPINKNPWKEGLGWHQLAPSLQKSGYEPDNYFLFSDRYQMTSLLSFYGPEQKRAYFLNIHGLRRNQFSYWPGMPEECVGKSGYFVEVLIGKDPKVEAEKFKIALAPYFATVEVLPAQPLFADAKMAILLRCVGYNGKSPQSPDKY